MSKLLLAFGIALAAAGLAACESLDKRGVSRETQGTVGGAVAGGAVGGAATGGSAIGTIGGAVVGGAIGNEVGENQDEKRGRK
jgi:osmotically inducible lipoprotein OsmB